MNFIWLSVVWDDEHCFTVYSDVIKLQTVTSKVFYLTKENEIIL